jgi:hypothetical protein
MAQVDWNAIMGVGQPKRRYAGANVKFFNAYNENKEKTLAQGRPIFDEIPSISIQWPGGDETVRRIEPHDIAEYSELYAAFTAGNQPVESGTPLAEWPLMNGSAMREFQHIGFRTVEQVASANDEVKRKLGPLGKFIKLAQDWLAAANSDQAQVTALKQQLDREQLRTARLEEQLELMMQRIEGLEGTDLRPQRRKVFQPEPDIEDNEDDFVNEEVVETPKRRGRPRKV